MKPDPRRDSNRRRPNTHANLLAPVPRLEEEDVLELVRGRKDAFLLVLDGVQDPHNLGACLRTANAAGVQAVIAPKDRAVALTETARQVACGAAERTPFVQVTNLARFLSRLQEAGLWLVGTADEATQSIYQTDLKGPLAIVMGAEGKGIRRLTAESCDFLVRIPMNGHVDCLNVSVATGVCLFEALRQRQG
jgi:23S rRNA (guanosine2251-2'-O)-methyltransferase